MANQTIDQTARHVPVHGGSGSAATSTCTPVSKRKNSALYGIQRIFMHPTGHIRQKPAELGIFEGSLDFGTKRPWEKPPTTSGGEMFVGSFLNR